MSIAFHHLPALGWLWVVTFVAADVVAVICVVRALQRRERAVALRATAIAAAATFACVLTTVASVFAGLAEAESVAAGPAGNAVQLASGISVAMNGAVFGLLFIVVAGVCTVCCLAIALASKPKPSVTARS